MKRAAAIVMLVSMLAAQGCLERRVQITSEPPGATVWVNDVEVGRTPCTTGFLFYGEYDVRATKEGCQPLVTSRGTPTPIWEYAPLDLVATALPFTITNTVKWQLELKPNDPAADEPDGLIKRASEMRSRALSEATK